MKEKMTSRVQQARPFEFKAHFSDVEESFASYHSLLSNQHPPPPLS